MRLVVARRLGRRGEGLGNEFISWSKGFIASQVLGARLIGPGWGINARRYYRNFGTNRLDFVLEELLWRLPHHKFTEQDYWASGEIDFGRAIGKWADAKRLQDKSSFVVSVDGMYGGYAAISQARPFLWKQILSSKDALRNVYDFQSRLDPQKLLVAVHMRFGSDFSHAISGESVRSKFNVFIPTSWYMDACEAVKKAFGDRVQFRIFTDKPCDAYREVVARFNPGQTAQTGLTETSDLALMAMADLRICSVSSYSLAASFLSSGPYLWYEPQLTLNHGMYSLWGYEKQQQQVNSRTRKAARFFEEAELSTITGDTFKGWPYLGPEALPHQLVVSLEQRLRQKQHFGDLLSYGVVPVTPSVELR